MLPKSTYTGFVYKIFDTLQVTEKIKRREFILNVDGGAKYPEQLRFTLREEDCHLIDPFQPGDKLRVTFVVRGRAYPKGDETFYFLTLEVEELRPDLG